jgi:hypothetical protein
MLFGEPVTGDEDMQEALDDGEILDEDANPELLRQNEMEAKARAVLNKSATQEAQNLKPAPSCMKQIPGIPLPTAKQLAVSSTSGIPDEMLCIVCMDRRKEIMI